MKTLLFTFCACFFAAFTSLSQTIELELVKDGFSSLLNLQNAGDDRLFAVEQSGRIKILNPDNTVNATPFLNLAGQVGTGGEQGLLGLAFHPDYATNGFFYVNYVNTSGDTQVVRYTVSSDANVADPATALPIIGYDQPFGNHNGGDIKFGPDGFLYISSGDGGSGGDPGNRAQNTTLLLGKLLRIDVDNPIVGGNNYGIPADNPFAGDPVNAEEIWAYGLRNAWRFNFDSENGDLWIADVGQGEIEEINMVKPVADVGGLNYGWRCYEGNDPFNTSGCPPVEELVFPVAEYNHPIGFSITGGYVYRGTLQTNLIGLYFYADFVTGIVGFVDNDGNLTNLGSMGGSWASFGTDVNNELYIVDYSGSIFRIVDPLASVNDLVGINAIKMFPNPATSTLSFSSETEMITEIKISDVKGSLLLTEKNISNSNNQMNIGTLKNGIYLVSLTTQSGNTVIKKLIVE